METSALSEWIFALWGLIPLLYAETHYSFKGIYSRLRKTQPEIIADVPHRLEPSVNLPVLILIKDADQFPVILHSVAIEVRWQERTFSYRTALGEQHIAEPMWHDIVVANVPQGLRGPGTVDVRINVSIGTKRETVRNDNHNGTSHQPFRIYFAGEPLPGHDDWHFGEFHCHSSYTSDQVEFGAPLPAIRRLGMALGLTFACVTDHSYDLDDAPDDYLTRDMELRKWKAFRKEVSEQNGQQDSFVIIPGEEVSAGNHRGRNVHFLLLNHPDFVPGSGDSAEKWFRTRPDLSIGQIVDALSEDALAFAAHPGVRPPFLEWLLIRRGRWENRDIEHERLNGLQIWNGTENGFGDGKRLWIEALLSGRRLYIAAGNDAHGNFGRFRQIGFPFFTMRETHDHLFGKVRTGIHVGNQQPTLAAIMAAIRSGRMIVTDGPLCSMTVATDTDDKVAGIGDCFSPGSVKVQVTCLSNAEFGALDRLNVLHGVVGATTETLLCEKRYDDYEVREEFESDIGSHGYIRAELYTRHRNRCLTNPIWISGDTG